MEKIYFVVSGFPVVSHPFLYNQILEVVNTGKYEVRIVTFSNTGQKIHSAYESLNTLLINCPLGTGQRAIPRIKLIASSFGKLLKKPRVLLNALNFIKYSRDAWNFNYLILAGLFADMDANILHCHFGPTAKIISDLKEMGAIKGKVMASFHGADITVYPKLYGKSYYQRLFLPKNDVVFTANSRFIISKMVENGCPAERVYKVPMCLDVSDFAFRGNAPLREGIIKILTVGRFVEKKGYEYSLKAIAKLKANGIQFIYHIIGEGPLKESMMKLAQELGINDDVKFHGAMLQEDVKGYYQAAHIFLLPSVTAANGDTEGQGLVLQEAQAIGLPVVATLHNGFPDSIKDGETGYLVPEKDPEALFKKLLLLCENEALCNAMGKKGRSFVEDNFDSSVVVKNLTRIYNSMLSHKEIIE